MLSLKRTACLALLAAGFVAAQPALTTIQDTIYRADGTRFTGTVYIDYSSFQTENASTIATYSLTVNVVNGAFRVRLVPTTTSSAGAHYNVRYNSRGVNDFTEQWAVPPSSVSLRVRDVRLSQGTVVGPQPIVSAVQVPDVIGLQNELAIRPQKGVGFGIGRTAMINQAGQLDAVAGNLGDCVRVDGSAGPCGSGSSPNFIDNEVPVGTINGTNAAFALSAQPQPSTSLHVYRNGVLQQAGVDFLLTGVTVTFFGSSIPQPGDTLIAAYRFGPQTTNLSSIPPEIFCSGAGGTISSTVLTQVGSCTIPAGTLTTGDRLAVDFGFGHTGTASGFTVDLRAGTSTVILNRTVSAAETLIAGHGAIGSYSAAQIWDASTFGTISAQALVAGISTEDITQDLTISFRASLTAASADTISLRNFTVTRYPAH